MPATLLRLEKKYNDKPADKRMLYVEFQQATQNALTRVWNTYNNEKLVQKQERENFHTNEEAKTYLKNQLAGYLAQGYTVKFSAPGIVPPKPVEAQPTTPAATTTPAASKEGEETVPEESLQP